MTPEYLMYPIIASQLSHITNLRTGHPIADMIVAITFIIMYFCIDRTRCKQALNKLYSKIFTHTRPTLNTVILRRVEGNIRSYKYRAVMYHIALKHNATVYCLREVNQFAWGDKDDRDELLSEYVVDQDKAFELDTNIMATLMTEQKTKKQQGENKEYVDVETLNIYTETHTLEYLQKWIDTRVVEFKQYLKRKTTDSQLLITVTTEDTKKHNLLIESIPWESTITFENSYFHMKDELISKIDFFLNNRKWYEERGIPYNMGILLHGQPGTGKTRFIKQLMNYTKRHGIDIKLNDELDFSKLKDIIFNEEISDDYIIPQNQRIIIFEDIDAMGTVIKDRDIVKNEKKQKKNKKNQYSDDESTPIQSTIIDKLLKATDDKCNNNLSYLLNVLDGLNECSGRIIIMTTNKIDQLDKALIRPGRIDIKIEFEKCTRYDIAMMIQLFWKTDVNPQHIREDCEYKYTSAEIINMFRSTDDFDEIKEMFICTEKIDL